MPLQNCLYPCSPEEISRRIFQGDLLVFRQVPTLLDLVNLLTRRLHQAFGVEPVSAHERLGEDEFLEKAEFLVKEVNSDPKIRETFASVFEELGFKKTDLYWDLLRMRVNAPARQKESRWVKTLQPHRDSWGSHIWSQMNWWGPVLPLHRERTLALYPSWFDKVCPNDSEEWNFEDLKQALKEGRSYPTLPTAQVPVTDEKEIRVVIEPGDILAFSGAHLHATVPNHTEGCRFNVETRTVRLRDWKEGRRAPNVDGNAPQILPQLFRSLSSGQSLTGR